MTQCWIIAFVLTSLILDVVPTNADEEYKDAIPSRVKRFADGNVPILKVAVLPTRPYIFKQGEGGNVTYTGFISDVIKDIARIVGFTPAFVEPADRKYGAVSNGQWTGLVGDLIKTERNQTGGVDLVAAPLTITTSRERVVDFVHPFQNLGLTILIKKPSKSLEENNASFSPYSFMIFAPMTGGVWAIVILSVFLVAMLLWVMNKYNPYEWTERYKMGLASEQESQTFSLAGSFWFVCATLFWQGFEHSPRSLGGRTLSVFWFSFVTITLVTYTASLVNHLFWASMVHGQDPTKHPINSLEELILNPDYNYGCMKGSSAYSILTEGPLKEHEAIRTYWESSVGRRQLVDTNNEGVERVRTQSNYALIMGSMVAYYLVNRDCDLMTIGGTFSPRSYGFALPNNSPYLRPIHQAVLELRESGAIEALEKKWWEGEGRCWNVTKAERKKSVASQLLVNKPKKVDLSMFWGPLGIIACGVVLSAIVMTAEILYFKYRGKFSEDNSPKGIVLTSDVDECRN